MRTILFIVLLGYAIHSFGQCSTYEYTNVFDASWLSCQKSSHPALDDDMHWISYDFGITRRVGTTHIWNYIKAGETAYGVKEILYYHSLDGTTWTLGGQDTIPEASGLSTYEGVEGPDFGMIAARYIVIAVIDSYGNTCTGFSEIQINFSESSCTLSDIKVELSQDACADSILTSIHITPVGGVAPYAYYWSTGDTMQTLNNLDAGDYEVVITDDVGCSRTLNISLNNVLGDPLLLNEDPIPPGVYYINDTLRSSGNIKNEDQVSFLFSQSGRLLGDFTVEFDAEFSIDPLDCSDATVPHEYTYGYTTSGTSVIFYKRYIGNGNDVNIGVDASSESANNYGINTLSGIGKLNEHGAARFLSQATLGYDLEMIEQVSDLGFEEWLEWQLCLPFQSYTNHLKNIPRFNQPGINYWYNFRRSWWHNTLSEEDYLLERMAFALSQIFVISSNGFLQNYGDGMTSFYDVLLKHSFGNYRDLLYDVAMHPTMGFYLSHINNPKTDTLINQFPDENFAREILQLFSIGLYELNIDGTEKLDGQENYIPTYSNEDIIEFAKVFTGLGFDNREFGTPVNVTIGLPFTVPMQMNEVFHEPGEKHLLNHKIVPSGQSGMQDINDAIDNIFNHPNVGPFISTRLIQRFVKSEPSPDYVSRVAQVFNDNGQGTRGDLRETLRAILLDPEARDCSWLGSSKHGMLREPIVRLIHLLKAFNISNVSNTFYAIGADIECFTFQAPLGAPSVFNFFQSDYSAPGELRDQFIRSPEFQILDSYSSIGFVNLVDSISMNQGVLDVEEGMAILNFNDELSVASDNEELIDLLDLKLTYGNLSVVTKNIIDFSLDQIAGNDIDRIRLAIYLIANSPDFVVLK